MSSTIPVTVAAEPRAVLPLMTYLLILAVAATVGLAAAGGVRRLALRRGAVVPPRQDRWHRSPTPTLGGLAIAAGSLTVLATHAPSWESIVLIAVALAMLAVGWFDDHFRLSPLAKLVASLAAAAFILYALTTVRAQPVSALATVVAVIWFAGIVHAVNLLDNMDGLAGGVGLIAALGFAVVFADRLDGATIVDAGRAGGGAGRLPVLEPSSGAALHGRLREPVHRIDARGSFAAGRAVDRTARSSVRWPSRSC